MKKLLLLLPFVLVFSCSVQKRKYQSGYYVDWHSKKSKKEKQITTDHKSQPAPQKILQAEPEKQAPEKSKDVFASADTKLTTLELKKPFKLSLPPEDTCDVLVFKDGSEIRGKVLEVGINEIKYKRCDTPEGPTYISRKSEVFMIKYAKGTREVIKSETPPQQVQAPSRYTNTPNHRQSQKYEKQFHPLAIASLMLGILSVVLLYGIGLFLNSAFGLGILALPFLAALAATIAGKTSMNRIREQPDLYKGRGMALPGFIMGLIILGLYVLALLIVILFLGVI